MCGKEFDLPPCKPLLQTQISISMIFAIVYFFFIRIKESTGQKIFIEFMLQGKGMFSLCLFCLNNDYKLFLANRTEGSSWRCSPGHFFVFLFSVSYNVDILFSD